MTQDYLEFGIRPLHQNDYRDIFRLLNRNPAIFGNIPVFPGFEYAHLSRWLDEREVSNHRFVAETKTGVRGLVILSQNLRPRLQHSGQIALLVDGDSVYSELQYSLLSKALDMADNWLNLGRIELEVDTRNKSNIDKLLNLGFRPEGTRKQAVYWKGHWSDLLLLARIQMTLLTTSGVANDDDSNGYQKILSSDSRMIKQIEVRPTEIGDAEAFHNMLLDPAICRTTLQLPSQEHWRVEGKLNESFQWLHRFTAVADGEIVGRIAMAQDQLPGRTHIGSIGMNVHRDYWGIGIGTKLMNAVIDLADNWLNVTRLELDVNTDNPAGIRLYEKTGFVIEGTKRFHGFGDGRWADSYFMARIKNT